MFLRGPDRRLLKCLQLLFVFFLLAASGACYSQGSATTSVQPVTGEFEAYVVTYGPGNAYWERFGHNAIWLREPARELDHTFNFGFFDFRQENFLLRFVQGRMLYFSAAVAADRELEFYRSEGRSVRLQKLRLDRSQYNRLRDHLLDQVRVENREYLYDYYLDNCSTRIRDAVDIALGGALSDQFKPQPGLGTFRSHTRSATAQDYWYYLGLILALGEPVDREISRWEDMFLPSLVADNLMEVTLLGETGLDDLVAQDELLYSSGIPTPGLVPPTVWLRYFVLAMLLVIAVTLIGRFAPPVLAEALVQAWLLMASTLGILMLAVFGWTDHHAGYWNYNLLFLMPFMMLAMLPSLRKPIAWLILLSTGLGVVVTIIPGGQYMLDTAVMLATINSACVVRLLRFTARGRPAVQPGAPA